jgi:pimeloyl-ACP methyl ester carboxylesterase
LHGFASSPRSSKARFLTERLATRGLSLHCPDFNEPDFSTITVSRMIAQTEALLDALPPAPVAIIGSSLGGFVAWHVAARAEAAANARRARVDRMVLLAPAFDFSANRWRELGEDGLARWRDTGAHPFFHHAYGESRPVHYELYEDACRYRSDRAVVTIPVLVFQGTRDESVDPEAVVAFASSRPNMVLRLLNDGHQLLEHLETVWTEMATFLGLAAGDSRRP